jgi:hypothetical protein
MRNIVLIVLMGWLFMMVGCEPKPVYKPHSSFTKMYSYCSWCADRLHDHFDDSLQRELALVRNVSWSVEQRFWTDFLENGIVVLERHGDPDSVLNINRATRQALVLADSEAKAYRLHLVSEADTSQYRRSKVFGTEARKASVALVILLRKYKEVHNIADSEVVKMTR